MISGLNPKARSDRFGRKINRDHMPILAWGLPWLSIMLASLAPMLPIYTAIPVIPPLGFMIMIAWRFARPGLLPVWAGFPLGAFDDLLSGQPFGSAILLWSTAMLAIEAIENRFPWRLFWQDWLTAAGLLAAYIFLAAFVSGAGAGLLDLPYLLPQLLLSILMFPMIVRIVAILDRIRLLRIRRIG